MQSSEDANARVTGTLPGDWPSTFLPPTGRACALHGTAVSRRRLRSTSRPPRRACARRGRDSLAPHAVAVPSYVERNLSDHMGSDASWRADFTACALAVRSWAALVYDPYDDPARCGCRDTYLSARHRFQHPVSQIQCSTHCERHAGGSNGSAKYWVSWMTRPF
jgi:hypothetical protein